jgi:small subunit ribosomal protein S1
MIVKGTITKITNFGVFVELEEGLEGLLHISELSDSKIENPQDVVKVGQEVEVKILRVDTDDRKIGLSLKRAQWGTGAGEKPAGGAGGDEFDRPARGGRAAPARGGLDDHGAMGSDRFSF